MAQLQFQAVDSCSVSFLASRLFSLINRFKVVRIYIRYLLNTEVNEVQS